MSKGFGNKKSEPEKKDDQVYLNLLNKLLQAASKDKLSSQTIYQILLANQKKLDDRFALVLREWSNTNLSQQRFTQSQQTGLCLLLINHIILDFDRGNYESCLEIAIALYESAFTVLGRSRFPKMWADAQANLGNTYLKRLRGDKVENNKQGIYHLTEALKVYDQRRNSKEWAQVQRILGSAYRDLFQWDTEENKAEYAENAIYHLIETLQVYNQIDFPIYWAKSKLDLGSIYYYRIRGEKTDNIDKVIQYCQQSLQVYERENFPQEWSMAKFILATAYSDHIKGDKAQNIEKAILLYQEGLQECDRAMSPLDWGKTQYNLGKSYCQRSERDKAQNIEIGIEYLKQSLEVYDPHTLPQEWADAHSILGQTYSERLQGNKADNIEQAIYHCQKALLVRKRELYPEQWADNQHIIAYAYHQRILGDKSDNIERAILCLEKALKVINLERFPEKWADSQRSYGNCYLHRIEGDKSDNIERAIHHFTEALRVYDQEHFLQNWAGLQIDMATAYLNRIRGNKAENIERVIFFCMEALQIYTKEDFPQNWATAQFNLASGYLFRIEGEKSANIEQAICCLKKVLSVSTRDLDPEGWATAKISLGMAYQERIQGKPEENIDLFIKCLQEVLSVCTRSNLPLEWAKAHSLLGTSYLNRQKNNSAENIERAIHYFTEALSILTTANFPHDWAIVNHNLGTAYLKRLQGKSEENLEKSIQHYTKALQIFTPKAFPVNCLMSGFAMAYLAFDCQLWDRAIIGCEAAINASEILRNWETSEFIRQEIHEEVTQIGLYQAIVQAYINIGQIDKALEYVERSRSKRLVDLMASNDLYGDDEIPQAVKELLQHYENLQQQIDNLRSQNDSTGDRGILHTNNRTRAALELDLATIANLEAQKQEIWQQMRQLDPVLAGEIQVSAPNIAQMQQLIDRPTTAILSFFTTDTKTHVFILRQERITLHTCVGQETETLQAWLREEWLIPYRKDNSQWSDRISSTLAELSRRLQIDELIKGHLDGIEELIIIPHLLLHQIPFAAIPIDKDKDFYLGDRFLIRHLPSCQVLEFCQQRQEIEAITYGTVEDAEENLACASFEGEQIAQLYDIPRQQRLQGSQEATCKNYRQLIERVQFIHCCHHAESRLDNPLESRLRLADGSITLGQLMTPGWRLPDLSDVFLSCCETGLGEPSLSDDLFTLSTGFLCAGARTVISTLWSVDDLATALFSLFYYQQLQQNKDRSLALQQARVRLRQLTKENLIAIATPIKSRAEELRKERKKYLPGSAERSRYDYQYKTYGTMASGIFNILNAVEELPFSHPRYWAAFICQGLRCL